MTETLSTSRRERKKQEKLERIKQAARDLFTSQGYETTTIRHISDKADVAVGTVFLYFKDKSDLLIKLYEEDLEVTWQQVSKTKTRGTLLENLLVVFTKLLEFYNKDQKLSLLFLKEVLSKDASRGWSEQLERFLEHLTNHVQQAEEMGETQRGNATQAARNFFALYYAALTAMLSGSLTVEVTVQHFLRPALKLQLQGLLNQD